jgi:hypothetical protein
MVAPAKEAKFDTSARPSPAGEQKFYSMEEQLILARMEMLMNAKPFHYLDIDTLIPQADKLKKKAIVLALNTLVTDIRLKKKEGSALLEYQDIHFDEPDHAWLRELHPGVNVNGWRVFMVLMDPLRYGQNLNRPEQQVRGTITRRSAKS